MSDVTAPTTAPSRALGPEVQAQRDQLREAMVALEEALARPSTGRAEGWRAELEPALGRLRDALERHHEVTEGEDGLLSQIVTAAPHLGHAATVVREEHHDIDEHRRRLTEAVEELIAVAPTDVAPRADTVRRLGNELLGMLVRHRQRGVELTYQAFAIELGSSE